MNGTVSLLTGLLPEHRVTFNRGDRNPIQIPLSGTYKNVSLFGQLEKAVLIL